MRILLFITLFCLLISCESESTKAENSLKRALAIDSMKNEMIVNTNKELELGAKEGQQGSPIKIVSCSVHGDYELSVTYKNVSSKTIDAVKFFLFTYDNFEEYVAVNMGFPFVGGTSQKTLKPGASNTVHVDAMAFKGVTKVYGYPTKVHYKEGGTWVNKEWAK